MLLRSASPNDPPNKFGYFTWPIVVLAAFGAVYLASLTFVYVEGDDAVSIAHHVLGRDASLQKPYSPYHSLMDSYLSLLPPREPLLRRCAIGTTSAAAVVFVILMMKLFFEWSSGSLRTPRFAVPMVTLLAAPELFYLGLVYTPSVVAMCFMLAAHILVRRWRTVAGSHRAVCLIVSCVLFGLGGAARWDAIAYGAVITADLILARRGSSLGRRFLMGLLWGASALVSWMLVVGLTGYGPSEILDKIVSSGPVETATIVTAIRMQSLLTPGLGLLAVLGFVCLLRKHRWLAVVIALGVLPVAPLAPHGVPKWIISALPGLLYCTVVGFDCIWRARHANRLNYVVLGSIIAILIFPWLFGLQVNLGDKAWGPGFEIQPIDRPSKSGLRARLVLGPGAAVPTPEGPRAFLGHGAVLLGGEWRRLAKSRSQERSQVVELAIKQGLPILRDGGPTVIVPWLVRLGFTTNDPKYRWVDDGFIVRRDFSSIDGRRVRLLAFFNRVALSEVDDLHRLRSIAESDTVVMLAFSSLLRTIYLRDPGLLTPLGPESAIVHLTGSRAEDRERRSQPVEVAGNPEATWTHSLGGNAQPTSSSR